MIDTVDRMRMRNMTAIILVTKNCPTMKTMMMTGNNMILSMTMKVSKNWKTKIS